MDSTDQKAIVKYLSTKTDNLTIADTIFDDEYDFMIALADCGLLIIVDWVDSADDLDAFLNIRLKALGIDLKIDNNNSVDLHLKADKGLLDRGEFIPSLIKEYQKLVSPFKLAIMEITTGADFYLIGLTKKRGLTQLKKIEFQDEHYVFRKFGVIKSRGYLYILTCQQCNREYIWQLDLKSPPPDECMCDCGTILFDEQGNPYSEPEKTLF